MRKTFYFTIRERASVFFSGDGNDVENTHLDQSHSTDSHDSEFEDIEEDGNTSDTASISSHSSLSSASHGNHYISGILSCLVRAKR